MSRKRSTGIQRERPAKPKRARAPEAVRPAGCPVVALGASAGGLEALEHFLRAVQPGSGLAFVVVQHLDPTRTGVLPELLQRATGMKVVQAAEGARVEPDHVYVIPPGRDLSISGGRLHTPAPTAPRGLRLPIDHFFSSLAADQGAAAVAVVLSGMGADGTLGVQAVRAGGGLVLVQEPSTAAFDAMPRSAVGTGVADVVAPAEALPGRLAVALRARGGAGPTASSEPTGGRGVLEVLGRITSVLRARTGRDFALYKKTTLQRRVERRMAVHQAADGAAYLALLQENPQEQELLFNEFLIGVTSFFRDPAAWETLRDRIIPELLARHPGGGRLRAWTAGCSTGEEAFSLAMVFKEALDAVKPRASYSLQVFATDLSLAAIDQARQGLYPPAIAADVSPARLRRFYTREEDGRWRIGKEIREMVVVAQQDVTRDPPFTRLDLLLCRNLLIYLEPELQKRLLPLFHHALIPGGVLFLGNSETVGGQTDLFAPVAAKLRLYRRRLTAGRLDPGAFPSSFARREDEALTRPAVLPAESLADLAERALQRGFGPTAVLINQAGDVVYFSGRTGAYLEPAAGKADWNVFAMAREGLRRELLAAVRKAARTGRTVTTAGFRLARSGARTAVEITAQPLAEPEPLRGLLLVVFAEAARPRGVKAVRRGAAPRGERSRLAALEVELAQAVEELQALREEMRASQEELRSANEELQSTNEEFQSTNEELTTSKEELQSMNEELQTVNGELQAKLDELSRTNNDMKNLLNATEVATVFLAGDLKVRRFTATATRLVNLIPGDVGRPVTDLSSELLYPGLADDVEEVLRTLVFRDRQVATAGGRWFTVRIMPYRTMENVIDGVVITMVDITQAKELEAALRRSRDAFGALLGRLPPEVTIVDGQGRPVAAAMERLEAAGPSEIAAWRIAARVGGGPA